MSLFTALFITVHVHVLYCAIWSYDHNIEEILLLSLIIQEIAQIVLFFFSIPETCLLRTAVFNSRPRNELRSERHRGEKRKKLYPMNPGLTAKKDARCSLERLGRRAASRRQQFRSLGIWRSADNRVGAHHGAVARPCSIIVYSRPRRCSNAIAVGM